MSQVPDSAAAAPAPAAGGAAGGDDKKGPSKQAQKKAKKLEEAAKKKAEKKAAQDAKKADDAKKKADAPAKTPASGGAAPAAAASAAAGGDGKTAAANKDVKSGIPCEVKDVKSNIGKRVTLSGWAHEFRRQGEKLIFLSLRDGTGFPAIVQCVLEGAIIQVPAAKQLAREAAVTVTGTLKAEKRAVGGVELHVDSWELVGPGDGEIETRFTKDSAEDILADNRHLAIRSLESVYILKIRSATIQCFREHFFDKGFTEVTPPTIVQTQVEGGSTLFDFNYFGEKAYLTQSSQLYLETVVPVVGKAFCCMPSFRAEKSRTRRHLSEYTHFEGELGFITYADLLNVLEDMVVDVATRLVAKHKDMLLHINKDFTVPQKPFIRMNYADAVKYCNEHNIYKDEEKKEHFKFGDDIPEGPERKMTDQIGKPIFLCRFPAAMKPFYMSRCKEDQTLTESVDLLMPGVGEIIGGSMRCWDQKALLEGFEHEKIDPKPYYWYNDLRKFGTVPHGGWGLGIERYLCWIMGLDHIRKVCLYPRHVGRAKP